MGTNGKHIYNVICFSFDNSGHGWQARVANKASDVIGLCSNCLGYRTARISGLGGRRHRNNHDIKEFLKNNNPKFTDFK